MVRPRRRRTARPARLGTSQPGPPRRLHVARTRWPYRRSSYPNAPSAPTTTAPGPTPPPAGSPPAPGKPAPTDPPPGDGAEVVLAVEGTYKRTLAIVGCGLDGTVFHCWTAEAAHDDEVRRSSPTAPHRWNVVEVSHPRRIRTHLFGQLARDGMPLRPWDQTADVEASSANEFHRAIVEGRLPHDHDPLVAEHMEALAIRTAVDGSLRLTRPDDGTPCDAGLAARAAWWRAGQLADEVPTEPLAIY